jgi:hypothetical protein
VFEKNDKMKKIEKKSEKNFFSNFLKVHSKDAHEKNREIKKKFQSQF